MRGSRGAPSEMFEEAIVRANCLTVQMAAEEFALSNRGFYPMDVGADATYMGMTLTDLLPDGSLLENPFTLCCTEPSGAGSQGETGYEPVRECGSPAGYEIAGVGREAGKQIIKITDIDSPEGAVKRNCQLLREPLRIFLCMNNHRFPMDIIADTSSTGMTVLSYLYGCSLEDPYTGTPAALVNGPASLPGEIGYEAICDDDGIYACKVTGAGEFPGSIVAEYRMTSLPEENTVEMLCTWLRAEAETFARCNHGRYPRDIASDTTANGYTLLNLIQGYFVNPFTQSSTEPRSGRASNPGEIGYEAIDGGWGYIITGAGKRQGDIVSTYSKALSPADTTVIFNCIKLGEAIERFTLMNGGIPPEDVDQDRTRSGITVISLLPAGILLLNPVTGNRTEPQNHVAAYPGQTGYRYEGSDGFYTYSITGIGEKGAYIYRTYKYIARNTAARISPDIRSGRP